MSDDYDPHSLEGIPESGRERLAQNRQGLYTSDLSVNEFLLVTQAGFDPVGMVVGSSIFHIGFQVTGLTTSRELNVLSEAMYSARHLAMTRMEDGFTPYGEKYLLDLMDNFPDAIPSGWSTDGRHRLTKVAQLGS